MSSAAPQLQLRKAVEDPLAGCSDEQRRVAGERFAIVQRWRHMVQDFLAAGSTKGKAMQAFLLAHPTLSERTIHRWDSLHQSEGIAGLVDRRSTVNRPAADSISEDAWRRFLQLYLTHHQRKASVCWQIVSAEAGERGWQWPSLRTIQLRAARIPAFQRDYYRLGEKQWKRLHAPKLARDYSQYRAGECWVGDFHPMDVFCRRSDTDPAIVRPLLSAFLDLRSRVIAGWCLVEHENQDGVLLAFRRGIERWCKPDQVIIDNGKPYRAKGVSGGRPGRRIQDEDYVRSVFGSLEVLVHFSIPFNPDSKPVERWFGTLETQFGATFETYCGHDNSSERFKAAWRTAQNHPEKCPTLAELREKLVGYIDAYHATPHSGLGGLTPAQAFERLNPMPRALTPEGAAGLDVLLMRTTRPVKVTCHGVRWMGDDYGASDERIQLLQGQEVTLRIDPENAGYVIVCDLKGVPVCKAYNNRRLYSGVTAEDVAAGMKRKAHARRLAKSIDAGKLAPVLEDVTTAAIRARLEAGRRAEPIDQLMQATGTDDEGQRVRPLRSDLAEPLRRFVSQITPVPPPPEPLPDFSDLCAPVADDVDAGLSLADLEDLDHAG
jgi:putative transposase